MSEIEESLRIIENDIEEQLRSEKTETLLETKDDLEHLLKKIKQELKNRK